MNLQAGIQFIDKSIIALFPDTEAGSKRICYDLGSLWATSHRRAPKAAICFV